MLFLLFLFISSKPIPKQGCRGFVQPPGAQYYENYLLNESFTQIPEWAQLQMKGLVTEVADLIYTDYPPTMDEMKQFTASNFYGISGRAYMFLRLFKNTGEGEYLMRAKSYVEQALKNTGLEPGYIGYLRGDVGIYVVAAMIYNLTNNPEKERLYLDKIIEVYEKVEFSDEVVFDQGMTGLVHLAYVLWTFYGDMVIPDDKIDRVRDFIYERGIKYFNSSTNAFQYVDSDEGWFIGLGAGSSLPTTVIMYSQLLMKNETIYSQVEKTMEYFLTQERKDGFVRSDYDNRVQWCHGSPGFVSVYLKAYEFFQKEKYLEAAKNAAEYTAKKGVITKGMQLGHGVAGNIYMMLEIYTSTGDNQWLSKAISMLLVSLKTPELTDPEKWVSYDCAPGAMFVGSPAGMVLLFSDLLTHLEDLKNVNMPIYSIVW